MFRECSKPTTPSLLPIIVVTLQGEVTQEMFQGKIIFTTDFIPFFKNKFQGLFQDFPGLILIFLGVENFTLNSLIPKNSQLILLILYINSKNFIAWI